MLQHFWKSVLNFGTRFIHLSLSPKVVTIRSELVHPVGVPGRGFLPLRKNRLSVFPACRKRRLKGGRPVGIRGGGS